MDREEFIRYSLSQLDSLGQGLEGFSKLFHAVSANLSLQLAQFPAGENDVQVETLRRDLERLRSQPTTQANSEAVQEAERERAALAQQVESLQAAAARAQEEAAAGAAALRRQIEELQQQRANSTGGHDFAKLEDDFESVRSDSITAWDRVHGLEQELQTVSAALDSAQSDGISAWDRVLELEQKIEQLGDARDEAVVPSRDPWDEERSKLHRRMVELEDENASLRSDLALRRPTTPPKFAPRAPELAAPAARDEPVAPATASTQTEAVIVPPAPRPAPTSPDLPPPSLATVELNAPPAVSPEAGAGSLPPTSRPYPGAPPPPDRAFGAPPPGQPAEPRLSVSVPAVARDAVAADSVAPPPHAPAPPPQLAEVAAPTADQTPTAPGSHTEDSASPPVGAPSRVLPPAAATGSDNKQGS